MSDDEYPRAESPLRAERPRRFGVAWRNSARGRTFPVGILSYDGARFSYAYLASVSSIPDFRPLLNFPRTDQTYQSTALFPFFAQRVLDRRRPEFERYLHALALADDATDLDILGRSGGFRKGDDMQVIEEPQVTAAGSVHHVFRVHGVRHAPEGPERTERALETLDEGAALALAPQPDNPVNPLALLLVTSEGIPVGWIPDLLLDFVHTALRTAPMAFAVRRINGPDVARHLRLLVTLQARVPAGCVPFSGPAWTVAHPAGGMESRAANILAS